MAQERPVLSSAVRIGICTLLSRITGMLRDMFVLHVFGLNWITDAWLYAFQFPNLFRRLFGEGALAAVFVPTFARKLETDDRREAWQLLARTVALLTVVVLSVILLLELVILLIYLLDSGGSEQTRAARTLVLGLTALTLPFMLTICLLALFSSILNCLHSFVPPALAPVILNVCMIVATLFVAPWISDEPRVQIVAVASSILLAGVLQLAMIVPVMRAHNVQLGWRFEPRDPEVRRMLANLGPITLGQGLLLLGTFLDSQICLLFTRVAGAASGGSLLGWTFAYPLEEGALATINVAQRLYQFPLGVAAISIAVAALPALTRYAARDGWQDWSVEVRRSFRMTAFVGLLAGAMMIVHGDALVRMLFEYGRFTAADTARATPVVAWFGVGMAAFSAQQIVLRGFYSVGDVRTPLKMNLVLVPANVAISMTLIWFESIRESAFAISSTLTSTTSVAVGLFLLHRRHPDARLVRGPLLTALGRMVVAAVVAGVGLWLLRGLLAEQLHAPTGIAMRAIETFGGLTAGTAVFLSVAVLLRLPEPVLLLQRLARRG